MEWYRKSVELRAIDRSSKDDKYFRLREVNSTRIQILLRESLDELVDSDTPHSILKFKIQCNSALPSSNRRNHDVSEIMEKKVSSLFFIIYARVIYRDYEDLRSLNVLRWLISSCFQLYYLHYSSTASSLTMSSFHLFHKIKYTKWFFFLLAHCCLVRSLKWISYEWKIFHKTTTTMMRSKSKQTKQSQECWWFMEIEKSESESCMRAFFTSSFTFAHCRVLMLRWSKEHFQLFPFIFCFLNSLECSASHEFFTWENPPWYSS